MPTRHDLIEHVAAATQLPKSTVTKVINQALISITQLAAESPHLQLRGFGAFRIAQRAASQNKGLKGGRTSTNGSRYLSFSAARCTRSPLSDEVTQGPSAP